LTAASSSAADAGPTEPDVGLPSRLSWASSARSLPTSISSSSYISRLRCRLRKAAARFLTSRASFLLRPSVDGGWNSATVGSDLRFLPVPVNSFLTGGGLAADEELDDELEAGAGGGGAQPSAATAPALGVRKSAYGSTLPPLTVLVSESSLRARLSVGPVPSPARAAGVRADPAVQPEGGVAGGSEADEADEGEGESNDLDEVDAGGAGGA